MAALVRARSGRPGGGRSRRVDDDRCRDTGLGRRGRATARRRSGAPRPATRRRSPRPASRRLRGSGWTRSPATTGRSADNGWCSAGSAIRSRGASSFRPSRSPPARSDGSSSSAPMTARPRDSRRSTSRVAAPGRSARNAPSSGGRPSTRPARSSTRCASTARPERISGSGAAGSTRPRRPSASSPRSHPTRDSGGRSRPNSRWDVAGDRLAIQSCGEVACRTRVIAPGGGPARLLDAPDLGLLVGLDGDRVVTYASCRGLPCPIVSTDLATGRATTARRRRRVRDARPNARRDPARP